MVMKVNNVGNVFFKQNPKLTDSKQSVDTNCHKYTELSNVIPTFGITAPSKYTLLSVEALNNGLKVYSYKLSNGHRITIVPMEGSPAVVKNYVNVGSMNETSNIKGISHFLEHMAFNGTNGEDGYIKLDVGDSFKKIDELGGWANASTNYAVTDYVNSTPLLNQNDLEKQIQIIAAMTEDLKLSKEMIEKEKGPVCSEINMILDDPQTIAMDQTVRSVFGIKNSTDEMVGGSVKQIQNLTQKDVKSYYDKYYTPNNMNLVITGDVEPEKVIEIVAKNFKSQKMPKGQRFEEPISPIQKTVRKDFINDKATSAEIVLGFAGPKNSDIKSKVIYDVASQYLSSYSSNLEKNLKEFNAYPYLSSEKISTNPNANKFIYLATSCNEKDVEKVLKGIYSAIQNIEKPSQERVDEIKKSLLKTRATMLEYSSSVNDAIGNSLLNGTLEHFTKYEKFLSEITPEDVTSGINEFFDLNTVAITVVHPAQNSKAVSFQSKKRQPINTEKISEYKTLNNYDVGFYETKSNNFIYKLQYSAIEPYNKKAGVVELLDIMYTMGYLSKNGILNEFDAQKFKEKNNIEMEVSVSPYGIKFYGNSDFDNKNLILENVENVIDSPILTEENLEKAKNRLKDSISRLPKSSYRLYDNYILQQNPYEYSEKDILNNLDCITLEDIKDCLLYLKNNSRATVVANLPEQNKENTKREILRNVSNYQKVYSNKVELIKLYKPQAKTEVLLEENSNSQADIAEIFRFKMDNDLKTKVVASIMNSILSGSSIGLFDTLREKEHLAYSVHSSLNSFGDEGEILLNILTTTDNKANNEMSYENLQKSIDGFNRQINLLKLGKFTFQDLENAKLLMKSNLLNNEGVYSKVMDINVGLNSQHGITYLNKLYKEIDFVTMKDVQDYANYVFSSKPTYSIVASKDTLEYNKEYLEKLKK